MEKQTETIQKESNKIYNLVKKITEKNLSEDKKEELLMDLSELLDKSFMEDKGVVIEMATQIAYEKKEVEVFTTIMDEIELSIEYMEYQKEDGKYCSSSMFLLPFVISSEKATGILPSIQKFEDKIKQKLVEFNIVKDAGFFTLATSRFNHPSAENMELSDWWNLHRDSISENPDIPDIKKVRNEDITVDLKNENVIIYLVAKMDWDLDDDTTEPDISALLDSNSAFLESVGKEMSTEDVEITMFAMNSIQGALKESSMMMEQVQFEMFFNKYEEQDPELEIAYAQLEEDPNNFCVMFIDSESKTLNNYYMYETDPDLDDTGSDFVKMLIERVMNTQMRTLWKLDKELNHDILEEWSKSQFSSDISEHLKNATLIDVDAIYGAYNGYNSKPNKPTLH